MKFYNSKQPCPKCGKDIELVVVKIIAELGKTMIIIDGIPYYKDLYEITQKANGYYCPKCDEKLFDDRDDVINFLKGNAPKV